MTVPARRLAKARLYLICDELQPVPLRDNTGTTKETGQAGDSSNDTLPRSRGRDHQSLADVCIIRLRYLEKVLHGDGGHPLLMQRMRAQANFIENTPIILVLIAVIELTGKGGRWIAFVGALFLLARVFHAIGMDRNDASPLRAGAVLVTMLTAIGLAAIAILIALGVI